MKMPTTTKGCKKEGHRNLVICNVFRFLNRKKLLEILNGGIDPPIIIFVNQKKVRFSTCLYSIITSY